MLEFRAKEHKQFGKSFGVLEHILRYEIHKNRKKMFFEENKNLFKPLELQELQKQNEVYKSQYCDLKYCPRKLPLYFLDSEIFLSFRVKLTTEISNIKNKI